VRGASFGFWMGTMCLGVLITALAATVCLGMIAYYQPPIFKVYPVLATFAGGALVMLTSAAQLERLSAAARHRDIK
jgi:hypothetical protein